MIETVINYKPEYVVDKAGHRVRFRYEEEDGRIVFVRDEHGELIPDLELRAQIARWKETLG